MADTVLGKVSLTPKGEYNPSETYMILDYVRYNGSGFIARKECTGVIPVDGEYYMLAVERGEKGETGGTGPAGPQGPQGISGVAVAAEGQYAFNVNENGHLILYYEGDTEPDFSIGEDGHLYLNIE